MKSHSQLVFHAPLRRNTSDFAFAEDLSAGTLAAQMIS